jgi:N-acetylmuramoyl-L-alanine amidase
MNRSRVRVSSTPIAAALLALLVAAPLCAYAAPPTPQASAAPLTPLWFQGSRLVLDRATSAGAEIAVATRDTGLQRFLARLGATLAFDPGQNYIIITSEDRRTVVFSLGDPSYTIGGVRARAAFAPYLADGDAVIPFYELARALYVVPVANGEETVLQPRIGGLDVQSDPNRTTLTLRGAMALGTPAIKDSGNRVTLTFTGQGSALAASSRGIAPGLDAVDIQQRGTIRVPVTTVTVVTTPGDAHRVVPGDSPNSLTLSVDVPGEPNGLPQTPSPTVAPPVAGPEISPSPYGVATVVPPVVAGRATVTDITIAQGDADALIVHLALSGAAQYQWHRLADHRWYLDLAGTTMSGPGRDEHPGFGAVNDVRIRQTGTSDAPVVRIAFTSNGDQRVDLVPAADGLTITVGTDINTDVAHIGNGSTGGVPVPASAATPAPYAPQPAATPWKYAGGNPRLIVIDPGHGGADTGAAHNGLQEKVLTMEMAQRLRTLLIAQGWTVKLTHDTDIDPVSAANEAKMHADGLPHADDRAYLQTRCDTANDAGARLFISIHVNSAPVESAAGTTFYWYKPQDAPFAQALERATIPLTGTQDDGARHENFYVTRHTTMPAVLVETAFITNPGDVARLRSPAFLQSMAQGIANGVRAFAGSPLANPAAVEGGR